MFTSLSIGVVSSRIQEIIPVLIQFLFNVYRTSCDVVCGTTDISAEGYSASRLGYGMARAGLLWIPVACFIVTWEMGSLCRRLLQVEAVVVGTETAVFIAGTTSPLLFRRMALGFGTVMALYTEWVVLLLFGTMG